MREILFRGKQKDNGKWIYGYLYRISEKMNPFIMLVNKSGESCEIIPETVGQYTGMQDMNGTKIFEGDIVKFGDFVYSIEWKADRSGYGYAEKADRMLEQDGGHCAIIGNIHDNSGLVEVKNENINRLRRKSKSMYSF